MSDRRSRARQLRYELAERAYATPHPEQLANSDEVDHPYIGNFGKGLPHNEYGEADRSIRLGEQIALTVMREQFALTNERAGLSLITFDGHRVTV
jgi:hypothetical protein